MKFIYTMVKPMCNIVKLTNDPIEAQQHSEDGWIVYGKKIVSNIYKHSKHLTTSGGRRV